MPLPAYDQITVPFEELHRGVQETYDERGGKTTRTYRVAWNDRAQFIRDVLGRTVILPGPPVSLVRALPLRLHDNPTLVARRCTVANLSLFHAHPQDERILIHDEAEITVEFETDEFDSNQNVITRRYSSDTQFLTVPDHSLVFASGDIHEGDAGILIPQTKLEITWHRAPFIPQPVFDFAGHVNSHTFEGKLPGTILFVGCQGEETVNVVGDKQYTFTMSFAHRRIPHNHFFNKRTGTFQPAVYLVSGNPPYPSADFNLIFQ